MIGIDWKDDDDIEAEDYKRINKIVEWEMRKDYFHYAITGIKKDKKIGVRERLEDLRYSLTRWELYHGNYGFVFLFGYGRTGLRNNKENFSIHTPLFSIYYIKGGME